MSLKKCVVSFADRAGTYQKKMLRLERSLKDVNFDGDFLGFTSYEEIGCEPHSVIPYKFKPYAIQKAIDLGYDLVLWADSPVYAKHSIQPVFDHIEKHGYLFFDNIGHGLGDWTNDATLAYFNITRQDSWRIKMIMACVMGFDFRKDRTIVNHKDDEVAINHLFSIYKNYANGLYPGEWNNDDLTESQDSRVRGHRHDQSVMSAIIHTYGLNILRGQDTFFAYESHREVLPIADSVCLFSAG